MSNKSKLIVALDVPNETEALAVVEQLRDTIDIFKIGLQLFIAEGPAVVEKVQRKGAQVFLDLKLHDIPNTVAAAVTSAKALGVFALTVHISGGREMLEKAASITDRPRLWGVSVLTSLHDVLLQEIGIQNSVVVQVQQLAKLAKESCIDGIVCSPLEIEAVRKNVGEAMTIICPGVRPAKTDDDQKRTLTPREAIAKGADFIVVGRPILEAADRRKAAFEILKEIGEQ